MLLHDLCDVEPVWTSGLGHENNYHILKWLKVNSWLFFCEMKQVLMRAISQTFSPPPQELIGRVEHYLEETMQRFTGFPDSTARTIAMEDSFNGYKRYLGLE
jgi:hypothetical protein